MSNSLFLFAAIPNPSCTTPKGNMITVHACSRNDSTTISRNIDPKSKDEFDNDISEIVSDATSQLGKFYLDFDTFDATDEQKKWVEEED